MSAFGGSDLKLSLPSLQNGTNEAVFILPAMRSGRSVKNIVMGLTPVRVSLFVALSKVMPFELWTNRKSACFAGAFAGSLASSASADRSEARHAVAKAVA